MAAQSRELDPAQNQEPQTPIEDPLSRVFQTRFTRRRLGKFIAGAALAGVASRIPGARDVEASADANSDVLVGGGIVPVDSEFGSLEPAEKIKTVSANIDHFLSKVKSPKLVSIAEKAHSLVDFRDGSEYAPPPVYSVDTDATHKVMMFLTKKDNPESNIRRPFPNLGTVHLLNELSDGDKETYSFEMQGIYLGRTEHPFSYDNNVQGVSFGLMDIGYFGVYFGDPKAAKESNTTTRAVVPVFLGWRTETEKTCSGAAYGVRPIDSDPYVYPPQSQSSQGGRVFKALKVLDENIGKAVVQVQIDENNIPAPDNELQFFNDGKPAIFHTEKYMLDRAQGTKATFETIRPMTLTRAVQDRFEATIQGSGETLPIPALFPDIQPEEDGDPEVMKDAYRNRLSDLKMQLLMRNSGYISDPRHLEKLTDEEKAQNDALYEELSQLSYGEMLDRIMQASEMDPEMTKHLPRMFMAIITQTEESIFDPGQQDEELAEAA